MTPNSPSYASLAPGRSRLLLSEWTKLRTVRSTWWTVLAMVVASIGIAALTGVVISHNWSTFTVLQKLAFDPTYMSLSGLLFAELVVGVLGVLVMSAEYGTGTIRSTLVGTPRRGRVLAAKAVVIGSVTLVVGEVLSFSSYLVGQSLLARPVPHSTLAQAGVLRAVIGSGIVLGLLGLFALGIGAIVRHSAGAITAYVGLLLVVPIILQILPASFSQPILKFTPLRISNAMMSITGGSQGPAFSPWVGAGILAGYVALLLGIGGYLLVRRDA